jgi:hypothetical protein
MQQYAIQGLLDKPCHVRRKLGRGAGAQVLAGSFVAMRVQAVTPPYGNLGSACVGTNGEAGQFDCMSRIRSRHGGSAIRDEGRGFVRDGLAQRLEGRWSVSGQERAQKTIEVDRWPSEV